MCIKFIDTTAWFIEASHTTDYLNNVMIILPMHCNVLMLNDPQDRSSLTAGALRKKP